MSTISEISKPKLISVLCSVFTFLCPFLMSYPFFILYLMFLLHYILRLLSFLSRFPVIVSILLTSFLSILTSRSSAACSTNELRFPLNAELSVQEKTIPKINEEGDVEFYPVEALEFYKMFFETYMIDETGNVVDKLEEHPEEKILQAVESSILKISQYNEEECRKTKDEALTGTSVDDGQLEIPKSVVKKRSFEEFLKEVDEVDYTDCREVDTSSGKQKTTESSEDGGGRILKKEKEWKETLACKLYEEKHSSNVEGSKGMDLLWETYEEKASMENSRNDIDESEGNGIGYLEDEEDEEAIDVQVCCLHAFKFSGVKMNMGVKGRNLAKVVKGIRWLRTATKHANNM